MVNGSSAHCLTYDPPAIERITEASPRNLDSVPTETTYVGTGAGGCTGGRIGGNSDVATGGRSLGALSSKSAGRTRLTSSLSGDLDELPALRIIALLGRSWSVSSQYLRLQLCLDIRKWQHTMGSPVDSLYHVGKSCGVASPTQREAQPLQPDANL